MRFLAGVSCAALLGTAFTLQAQLAVKGKTVTVVTALPFDVVLSSPADLASWRVPSSWKYEEGDGKITVTSAPDGTATVGVTTLVVEFKDGKLVKTKASHSLEVSIGTLPTPTPTPPDPPKPTPPLPPVPIIGPLSVLIVFESGKVYPAKQHSAMFGVKVRDYLKAKCATDPHVPPGGDGKAYRVWDKDVDPSAAGKLWVDMMARPRRSELPWITLTNGRDWFDGPLPADVEQTLALLRKYGGP